MNNQIIQGDCLEVLRGMPDHSVDSIVTDPPAGIGFMQTKDRTWDSDKGGRDQWVAWLAEIFTEARRVLKPGGHAFVWALPKTAHWTAYALENAGFEIREKCYHLFGSGFPKSHNISRAIDRMAGAERAVIGIGKGARNGNGNNSDYGSFAEAKDGAYNLTVPATPEAEVWNGWGSSLKPAAEEWILARAPLAEKNIAANVLAHGTGALNIDACRVEGESTLKHHENGAKHLFSAGGIRADNGRPANNRAEFTGSALGRWPANVVLSHDPECTPEQCVLSCPVVLINEQSGQSKGHASGYNWTDSGNDNPTHVIRNIKSGVHYGDQGGAARYFQQFYYVPKPSKAERNAGCENLPEQTVGSLAGGDAGYDDPVSRRFPKAARNVHPTVKSKKLMQFLAKMVTPPGGVVLDCFAGSGTTALACIEEGFNYLLIEQSPEYVEIARARAAHAERQKLMEAG